MNNNNFDQLNDMLINERGGVPGRIKDNLSQNRRMFGFMGDVIELFLPRLIQMVVMLLGGSPATRDNRK